MIGVFGCGTVGKAVAEWSKQHFDTYIYDKNKMRCGWKEEKVKECEVIFLCVPTPTNNYEQDLEPIEECLSKIRQLNIDPIIIIKSSILPGTTDALYEKYDLNILHSPEFLSENTATEDFENQQSVYIGYPDEMSCKDMINIKEVIDAVFLTLPDIQSIDHGLAKTMELVKYTANCFYATKVAYFNSIYKVCERVGVRYDDVRDLAVKSTGWMNSMHTNVPGRHGLGYSGKCFPDNMKAFSTINEFIRNIDGYNDKLREEEQ